MKRHVTILIQDLRKAALILLLAPFVLMQGVAQGTMVQAGPNGIDMVLCQGGQTTPVASLDHPPDGPTTSQDHAATICAWVFAHMAYVGPVATGVSGPTGARAAFVRRAGTTDRLARVQHVHARGPPAVV